MGAARTIALKSPEKRGFSLEVRRLINGALGIRIFAPGRRAGIALPARIAFGALVLAFVKGKELLLPTRTGYYRFVREVTGVRVAYTAFDSTWRHEWIASFGDLLVALKGLCRRGASNEGA